MTEDATFEEGGERPIRLQALEADDLQVVSSLVQDAVLPITEMKWEAPKRRFSMLLNRFRWEDKQAAERRSRDFERVQSVLSVHDVAKVESSGVDREDKDMILSVLALSFTAGEDGAGRVEVTFAGDGALGFEVEALDVTLADVTRPYVAPSKKAPSHPE